jgi:hypothetical protein
MAARKIKAPRNRRKCARKNAAKKARVVRRKNKQPHYGQRS